MHQPTDALGILWMLRLNHPLEEKPDSSLAESIQRAGPEDVGRLASMMGLQDNTTVQQRLESGRQAYIVSLASTPVAYGWITLETEEAIGELGLSMHLKMGEAYIWDCATLPAYRGQRLYPRLLVHMLRILQQAGVQRVWIGTDADNLPSQRGVALSGFRRVLEILADPAGGYRARGCPGESRRDVLDAHYALFGTDDPERLIFSETHQ